MLFGYISGDCFPGYEKLRWKCYLRCYYWQSNLLNIYCFHYSNKVVRISESNYTKIVDLVHC